MVPFARYYRENGVFLGLLWLVTHDNAPPLGNGYKPYYFRTANWTKPKTERKWLTRLSTKTKLTLWNWYDIQTQPIPSYWYLPDWLLLLLLNKLHWTDILKLKRYWNWLYYMQNWTKIDTSWPRFLRKCKWKMRHKHGVLQILKFHILHSSTLTKLRPRNSLAVLQELSHFSKLQLIPQALPLPALLLVLLLSYLTNQSKSQKNPFQQ